MDNTVNLHEVQIAPLNMYMFLFCLQLTESKTKVFIFQRGWWHRA